MQHGKPDPTPASTAKSLSELMALVDEASQFLARESQAAGSARFSDRPADVLLDQLRGAVEPPREDPTSGPSDAT
ncbi:MAG: hypothetical protein P1V81_12490 [Planctomycetota bacterium]|nr:hypothetical protein [Planctomycetota bacterium]